MSGVTSMTVAKARKAIQSMDLDELNSARDGEVANKNRKSLLADIDDEIQQRGGGELPRLPDKAEAHAPLPENSYFREAKDGMGSAFYIKREV
tara:strand:+ start:1961 stop:2239 length:279 start_codon:yes stop_codon:yes gene_type:complete